MELRPFQIAALRALSEFDHTLLIAPTGSGKSLVFQRYLQTHADRIRAIFVSPLNALARQHEFHFRSLGLNVEQGVGPGGAGPPDGEGVWILNPEKLLGSAFQRAWDWSPDFLIVDEAHCVWEWGDGFRPEFKELPGFVSKLAIPKSFWCSATLPAAAREVILSALPKGAHLMGGFALPTHLILSRDRVAPYERMDHLRRILEINRARSGMIFVTTRASSERVQAYLRNWGFESIFYHAGMGLEERLALEKQILTHQQRGRPIWVVATSAFGMGMDYPFLEICVLFEPPFSLLALAQAIGRVGRSGARARAHVLWHADDFTRHAWLSETSEKNRLRLSEVRAWCESATPNAFLEKYFNDGLLSGKLKSEELREHEYPNRPIRIDCKSQSRRPGVPRATHFPD
jgi:ATP-dependent DNA helicase RecQ